MSKCLKVDQDSGDVVIDEAGDIEMVVDEDDLAQTLWAYLSTIKGDNYFYPDRGVPWLESDSEDVIAAIVRSKLRQHQEVEEVVEVSAEVVGRKADLNVVVRSTEGKVVHLGVGL